MINSKTDLIGFFVKGFMNGICPVPDSCGRQAATSGLEICFSFGRAAGFQPKAGSRSPNGKAHLIAHFVQGIQVWYSPDLAGVQGAGAP